MKRSKAKEQAREESLARLRGLLVRATTERDGRPIVYTIVRHVSRSGMRRSISAAIIVDGDFTVIDRDAAQILDHRVDQKNAGVVMDGAGMDMGFALVYNLSAALHGYADRGGYRLQHRWV